MQVVFVQVERGLYASALICYQTPAVKSRLGSRSRFLHLLLDQLGRQQEFADASVEADALAFVEIGLVEVGGNAFSRAGLH